MLPLVELLDSFLRGAVLISLSVALGGVAWGLWVLQARRGRAPASAVHRCLVLLAGGAAALGVGQAALLGLKAHALSVSLGRDVLVDFAGTLHFIAGAARAVLGLVLAGLAVAAMRRPAARMSWAWLSILAGLVAASGAWLTHAAGRVEHRPLLML